MWQLLLAVAGVSVIIVVSLRKMYGRRSLLWYPNENQYVDPNLNDSRVSFPSLADPATVYLSVIVPAYNEEKRIRLMLDETLSFLKKREKEDPSFTYELIIVDDGSRDSTTQIGLEYSKNESTQHVRVLTLAKNRGKGGAVKRGVLCSRGKNILFADADGATEFQDFTRLENSLKKISREEVIVVGSRAHLQDEAVAKRTFFRNLLMWVFHLMVKTLCVRGVVDTQCGFKLFTRRAAQLLFPQLHVERWAFDVELLYLAEHLQFPIVEVAVNWEEIPGSTLTPLAAGIQMARDLVRIRSAYMFGIWKVEKEEDLQF